MIFPARFFIQPERNTTTGRRTSRPPCLFIANSRQLPGHLANALRVLVSEQLITTTLNQVMHNTIFRATSTSLKEQWQNFENVFDYLIGEIQ